MSTQMSSSKTAFLHKIYTNDPILFKSYVNKRVTITTEDSKVHTGIVYTVDPVSESFVLMVPQEGEDKVHLKIIMRPAIKTIDCSSEDEVLLPELFAPPPVNYSDEEILKRKNLVKKLLLDNHFPVREDDKGVLHIKDTVQIQPPYRPENCICLNSIILNRIQTLLSQFSD